VPVPPVRFDRSIDALRPAFDAIRADLEIAVGFAPDVDAEAADVARTGPHTAAVIDRRDIPFVSIDPAGARDLDQALAIERRRGTSGYVVHYAIADVGAFLPPGGAIDRAARVRGVTVYLPDVRAPLHPPLLSEGVMSLLPDEDRQALVWRFDLDGAARVERVGLERALVRNRYAFAYDEAQRAIDAGGRNLDETIALLADVGPRLEALERERGGVALDVPEQIVEAHDGEYRLAFRAPLPVEHWNAQISLMTGMAAAEVMVGAGVGLLRNLPPAPEDEVAVLRRHANALRVAWPPEATYADFIRSLDAATSDHAALLAQASRLFRGAGYVAFDRAAGIDVPGEATHAAVAAPYAHVTAPLRRLADRFGNEIVLALLNGDEPASWVRGALPAIPDLMANARRKEGAADGQAADVVEAAVLSACVGAVLDAVVVRKHRKGAQIQIRHPAVVATVDADDNVGLGDEIRVRVDRTDVVNRAVELSIVP
jgi:exoribonuclease R